MTYSRVLVGSDLSENSTQAVKRALSFAHERSVFRVVLVQPETWPPSVGTPVRERQTREALGMLRASLARAGIPDIEAEVVTGSVVRELSREAEAFGAELIVVAHRGAHRRRALGSTTRHVIRSVAQDTLIVRSRVDRTLAPPRIFVAIDFQEPSRQAAARAATLSKRWGAAADLVHCIDPASWYDLGLEPDVQAIAGELHKVNVEAFGGRARETLLRGRPAHEIPREAAIVKADLVVIGNHGPGAIERALLGSVAEGIAEKAHGSVLIVRG